MNPLDDSLLNALLRTDGNNKFLQQEDHFFEYKEVFDRDSKDAKAKYLKELAALHNQGGGYLIFGVNDEGNILGLVDFSQPDNADLSNDANTYFSPQFRFLSRTLVLDNKQLFIIHVEGRSSIPTVCIKDYPQIFCSGIIYWRYSARSAPIQAGDLIHLMHSLRGDENNRLASVNETRLLIEHKPYLRAAGGQGGLDFLKINIQNDGERARVIAINVLEGNVELIFYSHLPIIIAKDRKAIVEIRTIDKSVANSVQFKLEIIFEDGIGTKYQTVGKFNGLNGKLSEAEIINNN